MADKLYKFTYSYEAEIEAENETAAALIFWDKVNYDIIEGKLKIEKMWEREVEE